MITVQQAEKFCEEMNHFFNFYREMVIVSDEGPCFADQEIQKFAAKIAQLQE
jgi:hypothetical protein